jgi:hypothetical protein
MRWLFVFTLLTLACGSPSTSTQTIDSSGGTVELPGGTARVVIPLDALGAAREIGVAEVPSADIASLPGESAAVSSFVALTPHGITFERPVTITLRYTSDATSLVVMRLDDEADTTWESVPGATFSSGTASFETMRFSIVVVTESDACGDIGQACCAGGALGDSDPDADGCAGDAFGMGCSDGTCSSCRVNAGIVGRCAGRDLVAECSFVGGSPVGCRDTGADGYQVVCCAGAPDAGVPLDAGTCGAMGQSCCASTALGAADPDEDGCSGDAFGQGCVDGSCASCGVNAGGTGRCAGRDLVAECSVVGGSPVGCRDVGSDGYEVVCCQGATPADAGMPDGGTCGNPEQECCAPTALGGSDPDMDGCTGDAFGMACPSGTCLSCGVNAGITGRCAGRDLVAECVPIGGSPAGCRDIGSDGYEVVCCQ